MRNVAFLLVGLLAPAAPSSAAQIIYTSINFGPEPDYVYAIDPETGSLDAIGMPQAATVNDLSTRPDDLENLYGTLGEGGAVRAIAKINRSTGATSLTPLSSPRYFDEEGELAPLGGWQPTGFSIDPTRPDVAVVLGLSGLLNGNFLYEVNLETGEPLSVAIRANTQLQRIAFSADAATLFAVSGNALAGGPLGTIDHHTGVFVQTGRSMIVRGIEFEALTGGFVVAESVEVPGHSNNDWRIVRTDLAGNITATIWDNDTEITAVPFGIAIVETPETAPKSLISFVIALAIARRVGAARDRRYRRTD